MSDNEHVHCGGTNNTTRGRRRHTARGIITVQSETPSVYISSSSSSGVRITPSAPMMTVVGFHLQARVRVVIVTHPWGLKTLLRLPEEKTTEARWGWLEWVCAVSQCYRERQGAAYVDRVHTGAARRPVVECPALLGPTNAGRGERTHPSL